MTEFNQSEWIESENVHEFIKNSDNFILERKQQFKILGSFYNHFLRHKIKNRNVRVLDLGCGDGRISHEILKLDARAEIFLVDGSLEMLENAKSTLKNWSNIHYIHKSFQSLMKNDNLGNFDFVVSALAIHHLSQKEKELLFTYIHNHLNDGGCFLNMDVVLPNTDQLEEWYLKLWQEWIQEKERESGFEETFQHIPQQYQNNPDNHPDTMEKQLNALQQSGFKNVDCHYKYGIFVVFSGER